MGNQCGGIGFFGLLTLIFITLKLCGVVGWSWFWVLLPVLAPLILVSAFFVGLAACLVVPRACRRLGRRRR